MKHLTVWIAALFILASLTGCSMFGGGTQAPPEATEEVKPQDEPPGETEAQAEARREEEAKQKAEAERKMEEARQAEIKRIAEEENRRATEVREAFGPIPPKPEIAMPIQPGQEAAPTGAAMVAGAAPAGGAPAAGASPAGATPATGVSPAQEAAPRMIPFEEGVPPLPEEPQLRVAVFSREDQPEKGDLVAMTLGTFNRQRIEDTLGVALSIAYVSRLQDTGTEISAIRFRPKFMKAALVVAAELPHRQEIGPMNADEMRQEDVDLVVYIGQNYR